MAIRYRYRYELDGVLDRLVIEGEIYATYEGLVRRFGGRIIRYPVGEEIIKSAEPKQLTIDADAVEQTRAELAAQEFQNESA